MSETVGIDLGTTNSLVAWTDAGGQARVLPNRFGDLLTPSVVWFGAGPPVVGVEARDELANGTAEVAAFFKRFIGREEFLFPANGRGYSATELSALVLAQLKADAEAQLGAPARDAVITVPAYFHDPERRATAAAAQAAGLNVLQLINEPTAAAIAYGQHRAGPGRTLLVYDLGGGTFDVTLLALGDGEGPDQVLTSDGDCSLGGKDWDARIVAYQAQRFRTRHGIDPLHDRATTGDWLVQAERAKCQLGTLQQVRLRMTHAGLDDDCVLDRAGFESLTLDLLDRTLMLVQRLLKEKNLAPRDVADVLLVGGSTRMPMVRAALTRLFGRAPLQDVHPDQAVALGAALHARDLRERRTRSATVEVPGGTILRRTVDVTTHSLGMIAVNEDGSAYVNSIILPKDRTIPCHEARPFLHRTGDKQDDYLEIYLTQGESSSPADVAYLGRYVVRGLPRGHSQGLTITIEYTYDDSTIVHVAARQARNSQALEVTAEALPPDVPERFLRPPPRPPIPHVTVYLGIDVSGSMSGEPLEKAKQAARQFLAELDLAHASVGLISVADVAQVCLKACQDARRIERAINGLRAGGGSCSDPFDDALELMRGRKGAGYIVTLADGLWGHQQEAVRRARKCHKAGIQTIAIGFGDADSAFLRRIASCEAAAIFTSLNNLVGAFTGIAQVITRSQGEDTPAGLAPGGGSLGDGLARLETGGGNG
jgi:molecular chaperone DnaK (HSP70)